jgi:3-dehydroquinate synthetase
MIRRCCEMKASVVEQDEREGGCAGSSILAIPLVTRWKRPPAIG